MSSQFIPGAPYRTFAPVEISNSVQKNSGCTGMKQFLKCADYLETEIRERSQKKGGYFFSPETMRFFSSRISSLMWFKDDLIYFITSEADKGYIQHKGSTRAYTVRTIDSNGNIETIGEFQQYETLYQARKAIKEIIQEPGI